MHPFLRRANHACFALILATEDQLLRASGYVPTGHAGVTGDMEFRSPEGFTCSRATALILVAEATLDEPEAPEGLGRPGAEHRGDDHQEHRDEQGDAVHGPSIAAGAAAGELAS